MNELCSKCRQKKERHRKGINYTELHHLYCRKKDDNLTNPSNLIPKNTSCPSSKTRAIKTITSVVSTCFSTALVSDIASLQLLVLLLIYSTCTFSTVHRVHRVQCSICYTNTIYIQKTSSSRNSLNWKLYYLLTNSQFSACLPEHREKQRRWLR